MNEDISFEQLSSDEQQLVCELLGTAALSDLPPQDKILPIEDWLESEYHVGDLKQYMYPFWKEQMIDVFGGAFKPKYTELLITGSLSTGKSFFSRAVWLRLCYIFSQFPDVAIPLGHAPKNRIFMAYLSVSEKEAELTGFGEFRTMIDNIAYFKDNYPRNPEKKSLLEFPNGLNVIAGSDVLHFIGQNLVSLIFDEANFTRRGGGKPGDIEKALEIYQNSHLRIKTRFAHARSIMPGMNILVSSATHRSSFTEKTIEQVAADKNTKIVQARVYETMPKGSYSETRFCFFLGNDLCDPRVIDGRDDLVGIMSENDRLTLPEKIDITQPDAAKKFKDLLPESIKDLIELVPVNFYDECKRMPEQALRDVIGHSQAARNTYFKDYVSWKTCEDIGEKFGLVHPFTRPVITVGMKDPTMVESFLDMELLRKSTEEHPLYIHIDQSVSGDSTGMACAHAEEFDEFGWAVILDFVLRIDPPGGDDEIFIDKCRRFVDYLWRNRFNIKQVSYDTYQSRSSIQLLAFTDIPAKHFSTDSDDAPWIDVAGIIYQRRLLMYHYKPLKDEWFTLIHDRINHKVDHPKTSSKDVADAVCSVIWQAWMSVAAKETTATKQDRNSKMMSMLAATSLVRRPDNPMEAIFGNVHHR